MCESQGGEVAVLRRERREARDEHGKGANKESQAFAKENEVRVAVTKSWDEKTKAILVTKEHTR